jgi:hypothetical protein
MLPYVDEFLPVHNLESLKQLAASFAERHATRATRREPGFGNGRGWRALGP